MAYLNKFSEEEISTAMFKTFRDQVGTLGEVVDVFPIVKLLAPSVRKEAYGKLQIIMRRLATENQVREKEHKKLQLARHKKESQHHLPLFFTKKENADNEMQLSDILQEEENDSDDSFSNEAASADEVERGNECRQFLIFIKEQLMQQETSKRKAIATHFFMKHRH